MIQWVALGLLGFLGFVALASGRSVAHYPTKPKEEESEEEQEREERIRINVVSVEGSKTTTSVEKKKKEKEKSKKKETFLEKGEVVLKKEKGFLIKKKNLFVFDPNIDVKDNYEKILEVLKINNILKAIYTNNSKDFSSILEETLREYSSKNEKEGAKLYIHLLESLFKTVKFKNEVEKLIDSHKDTLNDLKRAGEVLFKALRSKKPRPSILNTKLLINLMLDKRKEGEKYVLLAFYIPVIITYYASLSKTKDLKGYVNKTLKAKFNIIVTDENDKKSKVTVEDGVILLGSDSFLYKITEHLYQAIKNSNSNNSNSNNIAFDEFYILPLFYIYSILDFKIFYYTIKKYKLGKVVAYIREGLEDVLIEGIDEFRKVLLKHLPDIGKEKEKEGIPSLFLPSSLFNLFLNSSFSLKSLNSTSSFIF